MSWTNTIRHGHRWLSIAFTTAVVANIIAVMAGQTMEWLYMLPLLPLALLMPSGLYMFFLPYVRRFRAARSMSRES